MTYPVVSREPLRFTAAQWLTFGAAAGGLLAYLASLLLSWATARGAGLGLFDVIADSSRATSALFLAYLLLPLVGYAMSGAAALGLPTRRRSRVPVAGLAALLGLATVGWLAQRLLVSGQLDLGLGWYAGLASVLAACVAAAGSAVGSRVGGS
ncbi:MAG: hypothetical protein ACRDTM_05700 [Micromonosporaceae bacterium]